MSTGILKRPPSHLWVVLLAAVLSGCAATPQRPAISPTPTVGAGQIMEGVVARNDRFVVLVARRGDSLRTLAQHYLGDADKDWIIAEFNGITQATPGQELVIPLTAVNPVGVYSDGYQTVPILSYHRFGPKPGRMVVTPAAFTEQMAYLARNDYRVIRLADLIGFLEGKKPLPRRAVVITIDDGYASTYQYAYPLLKKYRFPATAFVYSDFVTASDALNWDQMQEMVASGLIDIQPHSKTHANLIVRFAGESEEQYVARLDTEIITPLTLLRQRLQVPIISFAYPYGDANKHVVERLAQARYRLGVTVNPGGTPFFAYPLMLHRSMIFGEDDLDAFKSKLHIYTELRLR